MSESELLSQMLSIPRGMRAVARRDADGYSVLVTRCKRPGTGRLGARRATGLYLLASELRQIGAGGHWTFDPAR